MKKILSALVISAMVFGAGSAFALGGCNFGCGTSDIIQPVVFANSVGGDSGAINSQSQNQGAVLGTYTGIGNSSTFDQDGIGTGFSRSIVGSDANELQNQGELFNDGVSGTGFAHNYNALTTTFGNSNVVGLGEGVHNESVNTDGVISTLGILSGRHSDSSADMLIDHGVDVSAMGVITGATTGTETGYHSDYSLDNTGATSGIDQSGYQNASVGTGATVNGAGYDVVGVQYDNGFCEWLGRGHDVMGMNPQTASANISANQTGNTVGTNNGQGTVMAGNGLAVGSISGNITGDAFANGSQNQGHVYHQEAGIGTGSEQWSNGGVYTGNTFSVGTVPTP